MPHKYLYPGAINIISMTKPITDKYGWEYYPTLPEGWILATMDDFHTLHKLHLGMQYLIQWDSREYFELRVVKEDLKGTWLLPFIEANRVFIDKN